MKAFSSRIRRTLSVFVALVLVFSMSSVEAKDVGVNWIEGEREISDDDYFSEGLLPIENEDTDKHGYVNTRGEVIIKYQYEDAEVFSEGLAAVEKNDKWGYINKEGKVIIPFKYDEAKPFSEGLAAVEIDKDEWVYINKTGKVIINGKYKEAGKFSEGLAPVELKDSDDEWVYINKTGKLVITERYEEARPFSEGLAAVEKNDRWGYIDKQGKLVISFKYDEAKEFSEGLAPVELKDSDDEWVYIDKSDKIIINGKYDEAEPFSEGLAAVEENKGDKWGYIDKTGKVVVPFRYEEVTKFNDRYAAVEKYDDKVGILENPLKSSGNNQTEKPVDNKVKGRSTKSKILIDGVEVSLDAYKINNENYFKLRDLAKALEDSSNKFEVIWNESEKRIDLILNESYTSVGGELEKGSGKDVLGSKSNSSVYLDGSQINMTAYNIKGNNYFRLRDVGNEIGFDVDWDGANNTILINTK